MNEEIILSMVNPYVKDNVITYNQFDGLFSILSVKEQYVVVELLHERGIDLIDGEINENQEEYVLEADKDESGAEFSILYVESIFKDSELCDEIFLANNIIVEQSNVILCSLIKQGNRQAA